MERRRQGEDLRRFCRRLERLRLHYSPSVQVPEVMAESKQLDIIHEESDDTSEIEWCIDILDPDYNPLYDSSSSSEDDSGKTPDKAFDKLSREEDDHRRDETPTSTSECVPQRERTRGREEEEEEDDEEEEEEEEEAKRPTSTRVTRRKRSRKVDDDGGYDTSEDQSSDIDVLDLSQRRRWDEEQPRKKKEKKKVVMKKTDGMPDLSAQRAREPHRQDEKKRGKSKKKKEKKTELPKQKVRRPWSEAERAAVNRHMSRFTEERRVPGKEDCVRCLMKEKSLKLRSWKDVKNFVHNTIVTLNRRSVTRKLNY